MPPFPRSKDRTGEWTDHRLGKNRLIRTQPPLYTNCGQRWPCRRCCSRWGRFVRFGPSYRAATHADQFNDMTNDSTHEPGYGLTDDDIEQLQQIKADHAERANDGGGFDE